MNDLRFWIGEGSIIDLSEVCGIAYIGFSGSYSVYKVVFKNGTAVDFKGEKLLDQYKKFVVGD